MNPEQEWKVLMLRLDDLGIDAFYLKAKLDGAKDSPGSRSLFVAEQLDKARKLRDDLTAFVKARVEAAKGVRK